MATSRQPKKSIVEEEDPFEALARMILEHNQRVSSRNSSSVTVDADSDDNCDDQTPRKKPMIEDRKISFGPVPSPTEKQPAFFFSKAIPKQSKEDAIQPPTKSTNLQSTPTTVKPSSTSPFKPALRSRRGQGTEKSELPKIPKKRKLSRETEVEPEDPSPPEEEH
jgi:hypothetical protein